MTTKEECESLGMEFVEGHRNHRGGYVPSFCRKRRSLYTNIDRKEQERNVEQGSSIDSSVMDMSD